MHENFQRQQEAYYNTVSHLVGERLKGARPQGFVETAGFTLANPAFFVSGRHTLVHKGLETDDTGHLTDRTIEGDSRPFAVVFSTAQFSLEEIDSYVTKILTGEIRLPMNKLVKKPSMGNDMPREGMALLGVTFSTVDQESQNQYERDSRGSTGIPDGGDTRGLVPSSDAQPSFPFAAYGYAALLMTPDRGSPVPKMCVRFFGEPGTHDSNLILPDGQPIDVPLTDVTKSEPAQNVSDFSLVLPGEQTVFFDRSEPRRYVGPLHLVNEITDRRDARSYLPNLTIKAIEQVLRPPQS